MVKCLLSMTDLDFYHTIKLINYIRNRIIKHRDAPPEVIRDLELGTMRSALAEERYLQPVLEDDPLLFSFEDEIDDEEEQAKDISAEKKVKVLEEQLDKLRSEFAEYKEIVHRNFAETLKERMDAPTGEGSSDEKGNVSTARQATENGEKVRDDDSHYFSSYARNGMFACMIRSVLAVDLLRHAGI